MTITALFSLSNRPIKNDPRLGDQEMIELISEEKLKGDDYVRIRCDFYEIWNQLFAKKEQIDKTLFRKFGKLWPLGRLMSETLAFGRGRFPRAMIPWFIPHLAGSPLYSEGILRRNLLPMPRTWEYPWAILNSDITPQSSVLDVGSGLALFPLYLAQRSNHVDSIDTDELPMNLLSPLLADILQVKVNYRVDNALDLSARDNSYDYVYCISVLEHLEQEWKNGTLINKHAHKLDRVAIRELIRVIKPRGKVILTLDYGSKNTSQGWIQVSFDFDYVKDLVEEFRGNLLKPLENIHEVEFTPDKEREMRELWTEFFPYEARNLLGGALGIILTKD